MKRVQKILCLLVVALLLLTSGVDVTLDRLSRLPQESSFTYYNATGAALLVYDGDLSQCKAFTRPVHGMIYLHRT